MKTCKDCIYYVDAKWCYLNPRPIEIITSLKHEIEDHWCGQFKQSNIWKQQQDTKQPI